MMSRSRTRAGRATTACLVTALALTGAATSLAAESWVREITLNLRTGPGTQFRSLAAISTGESVANVIERGEKWTKVQLHDGQEGWIPSGYLREDRPDVVKPERLEAQIADLRGKLEVQTGELEQLRESSSSIESQDAAQKQQIEELTLENLELRAGARWPEWITGASVLTVGMLIGAMLHRNSSRRPSSRIRL